MKLPEHSMEAFQHWCAQEHEAMLHLGVAATEFELHQRRLIAKAQAAHEKQDVAVRAGLVELGLNPDSADHHYHVTAEGEVQELKAGVYVDLIAPNTGGGKGGPA